MRGISWVAEKLLASQEGLCYTECLEEWVGNYVEGNNRDAIWGTLPVFAWRGWETPWKIPATISCVRTGARNAYFHNTCPKRHGAVTRTQDDACKQTPHKSRSASCFSDHERTKLDVSRVRLSVRPACTTNASRNHNKRVCQIPLARRLFRTHKTGQSLHNTLLIVRFVMSEDGCFRRWSNWSPNTDTNCAQPLVYMQSAALYSMIFILDKVLSSV